MSKTADAAYSLLDEIATNNYQQRSEHSNAKKVAGLYEVDPITVFTAQNVISHNLNSYIDI